MNPLSAIFGAGVALRNALYDRGALKVRKLARPVVSVGNLSVGGSGKTPFVITLGQLLKQRGITFDVLSRGYGRSSVEIAVVNPDGSPERFGDEPLLIARKLQVPVIVGADRFLAGLLAEDRFDSKLHLLDDGFQHRGLHRDFDIVLLPAADLAGTLLPVGRLREPLSSLRRADAVVTSRGDSATAEGAAFIRDHADSLDTVEQVMNFEEQAEAPLHVLSSEIWSVKRNLSFDETPAKSLAFCGIARPAQFFAQLRDIGVKLADTASFPDHHRYTASDIDRLVRLRSSCGATDFITTEKDMINLGPLADRLEPLQVARLRLALAAPQEALSTLLSTLERRSGCRF
jgi:tetraacyldisaccharide 4'-kinase